MAVRRAPGIRFETQWPPPADAMPRMDVAFFAGLAAAGPLHRPVAVESAAQYAEVFGGDVPLAWDRLRGEMVYANLSAAIGSFFSNGGHRGWVLRSERVQ